MSMKTLRKKQNRYRVLKTISYLLGFPLFVVVVFVASIPFMNADAFGDTKYYGLIIAAGLWLVSIIMQIVISIITKSYTGRTLFMLIISLILTVGGSIFCDYYLNGKIEEINENEVYQAHEVELDSLKYQAGWVITWTKKSSATDEYVGDISKFCNIYNIQYKSQLYASTDEDGNDINADGSIITYNKEDDAYYSPNGLYADGYVFGFKQAVKVIIDYNQSKFDIENTASKDEKGNVVYTKNGKDADEELEKALAKVEASSEWKTYKNSAEYQAAYGKDGTAYKFMLNEDRLIALIAKLSAALGKTKILDNSLIKTALDSFGISASDLKNLTLDKAIDLINGLGLFEEPITKETVMDLVQDFSYYQAPTVKPKFAFIEDETIRTYAYANYYGTVHGANVASVLIAKSDDDGLGHVVMGDSGYPASKAYKLEEAYELQARDSFAHTYYPVLVARRFAIIFAGIIAVTFVLFYYFKRKERQFATAIDNA